MQPNDSLISNDDKANLLNNYFCDQTLVNDSNTDSPVIPSCIPNKLSDIVLTPLEVKEILQLLSIGKAVGPDLVKNTIFRET